MVGYSTESADGPTSKRKAKRPSRSHLADDDVSDAVGIAVRYNEKWSGRRGRA
jgi:hypothetical protein